MLSAPGVSATSGTSITVGTDGLGVVSFFNGLDVRVLHCSNVSCSNSTTHTIDSPAPFGQITTSIAIGADGLPIVAYDGGLTHCTNLDCSGVTTSARGWADPAIAIGADGLPLISTFGSLVRCQDAACSSSSASGLPFTGQTWSCLERTRIRW